MRFHWVAMRDLLSKLLSSDDNLIDVLLYKSLKGDRISIAWNARTKSLYDGKKIYLNDVAVIRPFTQPHPFVMPLLPTFLSLTALFLISDIKCLYLLKQEN